MALTLFPHNAEAYEAAVQTLSETGKAAIIHPTGTGKSFIGFQFCADRPNAAVCWLGPSEYIYQTQLENWAEAGGAKLENIRFCTYAKLMILDDAELDELQPEYIVLDEFHRCGAEMWGKGVQRLLARYADVPILGLSATNIRYLDNQRDMAEELNLSVAAEMTLGEALVRGILNPPTYVLSIFSYQKDFEKLEYRVQRTKSKAVRDKAEQYLEALRRALDHADGLDLIFDKYMTERTGKYLVFCANVEHLKEMRSHVSEWFHAVDPAPHVYTVITDDPTRSRSFQEFKADGSDHLKLLFSIDMLNEGVHVPGVTGVILFRPTVSPIVFKQQIGRALSASKSKDPIIFDLVNNIENLYSIDAVQDEMDEIITYYRDLGQSGMVVNDRFRVIDELRDVRELFDQLEDTLSASWDVMYGFARQYYEENGNLDVPKRFHTIDGYNLGHWVETQRRVRTGSRPGDLTKDQIEKLDAIGMRWESASDLSWKRNYQAAVEYYQTHGNLRVSPQYVTSSGITLGNWIINVRCKRKGQTKGRALTPEQIQALDEIGMIWDVPDYLFMKYYTALVEYHKEHGDVNVPNEFVTTDGLRLGHWLWQIKRTYRGERKQARLTNTQVELLNELGIDWRSRLVSQWENGFDHAQQFQTAHGDLIVPATWQCEDGFLLGRWIDRQRIACRTGKLSEDRKTRLDQLGMVWEKGDPWEIRYRLLKEFYLANGHINLHNQYKAQGIWLARWLYEQKQIYRGKRPGKSLTNDQIQRLEKLGIQWETSELQKAWNEQYQEAKAFFHQHGHLTVPNGCLSTNGKRLDLWVKCQREARTKGRLTEEQIRLLNRIGIIWSFDDPWEVGFAHAQAYYDEHGDLLVPQKYCSPDGYRLGGWIVNQRSLTKGYTKHGKLTKEQIDRLNSIGMVWNTFERAWEIGYDHTKVYFSELGGQKYKTTYTSPDGYGTGQWIRSQLRAEKRGRLSQEHRKMLEEIGMVFS